MVITGLVNVVKRITPAYAGKSEFIGMIPSAIGDHPRLRGEKQTEPENTNRKKGSPPLTRGKVLLGVVYLFNYRITPAYAGKRHLVLFGVSSSKDHPRLRGEKFSLWILLFPI